jgi:hypothetical protein
MPHGYKAGVPTTEALYFVATNSGVKSIQRKRYQKLDQNIALCQKQREYKVM